MHLTLLIIQVLIGQYSQRGPLALWRSFPLLRGLSFIWIIFVTINCAYGVNEASRTLTFLFAVSYVNVKCLHLKRDGSMSKVEKVIKSDLERRVMSIKPLMKILAPLTQLTGTQIGIIIRMGSIWAFK